MQAPQDFDVKISEYKRLFARFNATHNLSAYDDLSLAINDSIYALNFLNPSELKIAIDIGSGAGLPAIFLALYLKDCEFFLFEPAQKKASFLMLSKSALDLKNINIKCQKIQNHTAFRADLICSRAAFKIINLLEISKGFYDEQTLFLLYKGTSVNNELSALKSKIKQIKIINQNTRNYTFLKGVLC